jgi:hypothetical protein
MIRAIAPVLFASAAFAVLSLAACGHSGSARLEGRWKGKSAEGVPPEAQAAANAFATDTEIDFHGDEISVVTGKDKQTGTYKVVREDKTQVTIVTDKDGPNDAQTFTLDGDKMLKWNVLDGKTITFARAPSGASTPAGAAK